MKRGLILGILVFLVLLGVRPWGEKKFLLVVVTDTRANMVANPEESGVSWDREARALRLAEEGDRPSGDEKIFLVYLLRGAGMALQSRVYRLRDLPYNLDLYPGFPGENALRLIEVTKDGSLVAEWGGKPLVVAAGFEWAEICLEGEGGRRIVEEGSEEVLEAIKNRANIARVQVFNAGWKHTKDLLGVGDTETSP